MARHFGKSPDLISSTELKDYLFKKVAQDQLSPSAINQIISAFRILQVDVLGSDWDPVKIRRPKVPKTLPVVFSKEEVTAILASLKNRKHSKRVNLLKRVQRISLTRGGEVKIAIGVVNMCLVVVSRVSKADI